MSKRRQLPQPLAGQALTIRHTRPLPKPPARPLLPPPSVRNPACGTCWQELQHDMESFHCPACGLDYGDGIEGERATYRDPESLPCAKPCADTWHQATGEWACSPCALPTGHTSRCWSDCQVVPR